MKGMTYLESMAGPLECCQTLSRGVCLGWLGGRPAGTANETRPLSQSVLEFEIKKENISISDRNIQIP